MSDFLHKVFVYRIYPTRSQDSALDAVLTTCREVYNSMVNWRKHDYDVTGRSPDYYEQKRALPIWKRTHHDLRKVHSQSLQDVVRRVDLAFQSFFRRVRAGETAGYPRLKGVGQYDSFTFSQGGYAISGDTLTLFKIGTVKAEFHRPIIGKVKTLTVRRRNGKWFACFSCEVTPERLPASDTSIGIDVGLAKFATLSDGSTVDNPRFFRTDEKSLAKAQRKRSMQKRGGSGSRKSRKAVSCIHERIRNRRHNFVHNLARSLVNRYGTIAIENLNIRGIVKNHCLSKSISDASWGMFRSVLTQKAESAVRQVVSVEPAYTSQDCSTCGYRTRKKLSQRVHSCPNCGLIMDRDHNAALNIIQIAVGLHSVGQSVEAAAFTRA